MTASNQRVSRRPYCRDQKSRRPSAPRRRDTTRSRRSGNALATTIRNVSVSNTDNIHLIRLMAQMGELWKTVLYILQTYPPTSTVPPEILSKVSQVGERMKTFLRFLRRR